MVKSLNSSIFNGVHVTGMASLTGNGEDKDEDDARKERVALSIWWIQIQIWDVGITPDSSSKEDEGDKPFGF